ncbi:hypothetical protein ACJQWK_07321 [Exserohilum turcicum]
MGIEQGLLRPGGRQMRFADLSGVSRPVSCGDLPLARPIESPAPRIHCHCCLEKLAQASERYAQAKPLRVFGTALRVSSIFGPPTERRDTL